MSVRIYFGVPGSGKTTHAAKIVQRNLKKGIPTFCNVDIKGSISISASDIGKFEITEGDLIIDEASIEYNNRSYKSLSKETIKWYKLYRHHAINNIHIYSQSYDDMDITLRRLADVMYLIKRTAIPGLFVQREIYRKVDVNKENHQIEDQYFIGFLRIKFTWGPRYWHMFDSWEAEKLPYMEYKIRGYPNVIPTKETLRLIGKGYKVNNATKDD